MLVSIIIIKLIINLITW